MNKLANRTLTINKTFDAPIQTVWDAWTKSEHILKWWAPKGAEMQLIEHNFVEGGKWKYSMPMPDGSEFISEGTYREIIELEKIVSTADFKPMTADVELHIHFEADGEKTKFTFSVVHPTEDYCKQQEEMGFYNGWGAAFDRLQSMVEQVD